MVLRASTCARAHSVAHHRAKPSRSGIPKSGSLVPRYLVAARKDGEAPVISKANMRFDFERTKCAHATPSEPHLHALVHFLCNTHARITRECPLSLLLSQGDAPFTFS